MNQRMMLRPTRLARVLARAVLLSVTVGKAINAEMVVPDKLVAALNGHL